MSAISHNMANSEISNSMLSHQSRPGSGHFGFQKFNIRRPVVEATLHSLISRASSELASSPRDHNHLPVLRGHHGDEDSIHRAASYDQLPVIQQSQIRRSGISTRSGCNSIGDIYSEIQYQPAGKGITERITLDDQHLPFSIGFNILRFLSALLIICDSTYDWLVIIKFDNYPCGANPLLDGKFYKHDLCGVHRETIRQILSVITMFGSIFSLIQIINIFLIIFIDKGKTKFRLFHPHTEVYIAIFLEEIPQAVTLLVFMYNCDCTKPFSTLAIIMIASSLLSTGIRYMASFPALGGNTGCCNTFWRCCCCRDQSLLCQLSGQDCFCRCTIPCPLFCCTVACDDCKWRAHTWMKSLFKTLSCFCSCCYPKEDWYGIRIMVNVGILCLIACLIAGGTLIGLSGYT